MSGNLFSTLGDGLNLFARSVWASTLPGQYQMALQAQQQRQKQFDAFKASLEAQQQPDASQMPQLDDPNGLGQVPPLLSVQGPAPPDPVTIAALNAARSGQWSAAGNLIKPPDPQIGYTADGRPYDAHAALSAAPPQVANRTNVNGTIIDLNDPNNTNRYVPQIGQGQEFVYGPEGKSAPPIGVRNMDGTIQALKDATAATEGTKADIQAGLDIVQVPMPDGTTQSMTRRDAAAFLGGGVSPPRTGGGPPQGGLGRSQPPGNARYDQQIADAAAKAYADIQEAGSKAPQVIAQLHQVGSLLQDFQGGKIGQLGFELASAANAIPGLHIDAKTSNAQAATAIINQMALQLRSTAGGAGMPGAMSNSDRDFLVKSIPGLAQSPEGRAQMIQYYAAIQQRNADVAGFARQWQQRYGRIDAADQRGKSFQDYLSSWSATHPLFGQSR